MSFISIKEIRTFCQQYTCETLTSDPKNKKAISSFTASNYGELLVDYLKNHAWEQDKDGKTKVYLIKDKNGEIAFYFSLKCGLLYKKQEEVELGQEKEYYLDVICDIMEGTSRQDWSSLKELEDLLMEDFGYDETQKLLKIATYRVESKKDRERDLSKITHVEDCYPAIELMHYCKNTSYYGYKYKDIPFGFVLFWCVVVPQICRITETIGCEYVYLFAADESNAEKNSLIGHYRNAYKFNPMTEAIILKPEYDRNCCALVQEISALKENMLGIWEEYQEPHIL